MTLFRDSRPLADELMVAMHRWSDERRQDAQGLSTADVEAFAKWMDERAGVLPPRVLVARPSGREQVTAILRWAGANGVAVTPMGGGIALMSSRIVPTTRHTFSTPMPKSIVVRVCRFRRRKPYSK